MFNAMQSQANRSAAASRQAGRSESARFYLDGLNKAVTAHIERRDAAGMTLRQELPFLQLNRTMRDDSGRAASLMDVGVTVRDGTPHLVLELRYDNREQDETIEFTPAFFQQDDDDDEPTTQFRTHRRRRDPTQPYALDTNARTEIVVANAPAAPLAPYRKGGWYRDLWNSVTRLFTAH